MRHPAQLFGRVFGVVYLAVGLVGFVLTGFDGFAATEGATLLLFEVNPLHNLVHLAVGAVLLAGAAGGEAPARRIALTVGIVYGLVGLAGFALVGSAANVLALNTADNLLHIATAVVALAVVSRSRATVAAT